MARTLVTCPETAHLEELEYENHEFGMLVTSCTRFSPPCSVGCARLCARLIDCRQREPTTRVFTIAPKPIPEGKCPGAPARGPSCACCGDAVVFHVGYAGFCSPCLESTVVEDDDDPYQDTGGGD